MLLYLNYPFIFATETQIYLMSWKHLLWKNIWIIQIKG